MSATLQKSRRKDKPGWYRIRCRSQGEEVRYGLEWLTGKSDAGLSRERLRETSTNWRRGAHVSRVEERRKKITIAFRSTGSEET